MAKWSLTLFKKSLKGKVESLTATRILERECLSDGGLCTEPCSKDKAEIKDAFTE